MLFAPSKAVANWLVDLVFPPLCAGCGKIDTRFCATCASALQDLPISSVAKHIELVDAVISTGPHKGMLRNLIISLKHHGVMELAEPLAARMHSAIYAQDVPVDGIVPVPLSQKRLTERGYNQCELLGRHLSDKCGVPCLPDWLQRSRDTGQQVGLRGDARRVNVREAFAASDDVQGRSLLLIDDVVTTGSTLSECAKALRRKGAAAVYALTLSHS